PIYYLIFSQMEKGRILDIGDGAGGEYNSDAQMNATFVSVDGVDIKVRYNCGVRNRGHGSRNDPPNNYRVNFPNDRKWEGVSAINLNTKNTYIQLAGNAVARLSGLPQPKATAVQVRLNGENMAVTNSEMYGSYVHMEVVDSDFISYNFPDDDQGDAYKCMRDAGPADWSYDGTNPDNYRYSYLKRTNTAADDFSRLIKACWIIDRAPDSNYVQEVRRVINVENWLLYFALNAFMENNETSLANGYGDDYYTYQGIEDPRFIVVAHDLDSIFGYNGSSATRGIFRASDLDTIKRFLEHPEFVGRYYFHLKKLIETTFSAEQFDPFLDELIGDFVPDGTIQRIKDFVAQRNAHVLGLIPLEFSINSDLPVVSGYYQTTTDSFTLSGTANSIETRSVLVNGQFAEWSPVDGTWDFGGAAGVSEIIVERGSDWKYLDDGSDGGTSADGLDWYAHPDYDDSLWSEGPAELGYGDAGQGYPEATVVNSGPDDAHFITTYFRRTFEANDVSRYASLQLGIKADDGAVVYLNGVEIENARSNLPAGDIDYLTTALVNVGQPDEYTFFYYSVEVSRLNEGTNVFAVEIHQLAPDNGDISFDLELLGILPTVGAGSLNPGINRVIVQAFDGPNGSGGEVDSGYIDIWYDTGTTNDYPNGAVPDGPVRLIARDSYLPGIPMLVRVEAVGDDGRIDRDLWDGLATLSADDNPSIGLSVDEVRLYNGRGSELVTFTGSGDFTLTADIGGVKDSCFVTDLVGEPITVITQPLSSSQTWDGIYYVTGGDFTIPAGVTLTLNPGTLVLIDGTSTPLSQSGVDIDVEGALNSLGTAERPVTITAANPYAPWGEIHHVGGTSTYQYTNITRAGHSPHIGHTDKGPAIRVAGATVTFNYTFITDIAGKTMYATDGSLEFRNCLFSRSVMGPEILGTDFLFEDGHIIEMLGIYREDGVTNDDDGIYLQAAGEGKNIELTGSVVAVGNDDGIDTLDAVVTIEDVIVRDFDDKGISVYGGQATINRCLVVENNKRPEDPTVVSIGAKAHADGTAIVNMDHTTVVASEVALPTVDAGIQSNNKNGETSGSIFWNVTNCIIDATNPVDCQSPYLESDIHISYSDLFDEVWPGTGNIHSDPLFVSRSGHDYNLQAESPCIDAGDPSSPPDPDSTRADMGALPFGSVKAWKQTGQLAADTVWTAAEGPYRITADFTVPFGVTLTIEPGVTVFFEPDTRIIVNGTLAADGLEYESIRFTSMPGASGPWSGLQFVDTTTDNRISHAVLEYGQTDNGMIGVVNSNLLVEHSTLDHTERRRIRTLDSSLIVRNCWFTDIFDPGEPPSTDNMSEHIWGRAGDTGWFIIENNVFGLAKGHNDAVDVDGPSRPNPIPQILNNTFLGSGDDALDLESDVHIEGNTFRNIIKDQWNGASGETNVISAGAGRHYVMARNTFYNTQHVAQVKDEAFLTFANNTVVDACEAAIYFDLDLPGRGPGRGADVDG
ncbi:MAG: CotH kinase family protein, partial [Sedimentisphaerales bacterium]|nr:CotH kinase family protein [Sedimentisphaerales bacterium]